jgi:hypothetical protein
MQNEFHDQIGYRIAVAAIGTALISALAGLCVIVAMGEADEIPKELWTTVSALGGGLLGLLAPSPTSPITKDSKVKVKVKENGEDKVEDKQATSSSSFGKAVSMNISVVVLLVVFGVAIAGAMISDSTQFEALAAASGAALIGLLAPSPTPKQD